ncbi:MULTISPECIES: energy transducer TonB [unclassified Yoonia]|uniref:energy transducer TonB n=1 Tax=unclassified Yoonia TaxID=2629118 RepID=UPI002AFF8C21|nr:MULTISPECIES: energy transducer TonB [unclassified Yoonia]
MTVLTDKMQTPGTYISAVGHVGLIGWLLLGLGMQSQPTPMQAMDVTVMSGEEFEQMMAARTPQPGDAPPDAPVMPEVDDTPPPPPPVADTPPTPPVEAPPPPPVEAPPPPVVQAPPPPPPPPAEPAPAPDLPPSPDPTQAPSERIASTPTAPPPPDAQISDTSREAVIPDETAPAEVAVPEQQATAPEQTATEIVIADERPRGAVETSVRPVARPARPTPPAPEQPATPEPAPTPDPEPTPAPTPAPDTSDAVADALASALAGSAAPDVPAGPPMTGSERDSFRIAVNSCWNVDPGSVAARVTVEVGFNLTREGRVDGDTRLISSSGDESAVDTAYGAARRAILRCQGNGYQLPAEKYDQWREVVITFDPSGMRLR